MTEDDIDAVFAVNVKVPFVRVGELAPAMARRGKGAIVIVGAMVAEFGEPHSSLYGASKAALLLLTKAWAAEFGPTGVRVNAVNPGPTRTESGTAAVGPAMDELAALAPPVRLGRVIDQQPFSDHEPCGGHVDTAPARRGGPHVHV